MVTAIIQARTGSLRLPGKVLLDLEGMPVLGRIIERVKLSRLCDEIVVATTNSRADLEIVKLCADIGAGVFCGSEDDVLDRYYQAARSLKTDHIVRITGDCPLIDPAVVDEAIELHLNKSADYTSNTLKETYPDGEDVEVFTFNALENGWKNAKLLSEREHVTPFLKKNPHLFNQASLELKADLSAKRWTLDNPEDYEFIKAVYSNLYHKNKRFGMKEIIGFLEQNPGIEKINQGIKRNEGYLRSIRADRVIKE
jgi:spore coat polysaccharide biosynthesis protein SpsF